MSARRLVFQFTPVSFPLQMSPRALLFDFDGVLLDTEWSIYHTLLEVFQEHGEDLPLETYVKCIGSDFATWSPESHLEELTGKTFDWKEIGRVRNLRIREEISKLDAVAGVRECLAYAAEKKIPSLVVSSSSHDWVDGWLEKLNLTSSFQHVVCRGDAPRIKPAPDLYLKANSLLPELDAKDCLVIEDSLNGMKAAHEAGNPVVAIPNRITACIDFSEAEYQFPTMIDFLAALKEA
ncbi:HAD family phosphatase [Akkermansiaceae bacterium]|nr:HAD family phosphatase [Akkermansiaceae bacterium]MDB4639497.1 HAD family phosphatase [Akkermansiaceae bacterium]MDB4788092.1 HAD family phosphatase [Akkermansiaceae bacterium]